MHRRQQLIKSRCGAHRMLTGLLPPDGLLRVTEMGPLSATAWRSGTASQAVGYQEPDMVSGRTSRTSIVQRTIGPQR